MSVYIRQNANPKFSMLHVYMINLCILGDNQLVTEANVKPCPFW